MNKPEEIKVLNIDNVPYAVDAMSKEVQEFVTTYNGFLVREAELKDWWAILQAGKAHVSQQIIAQVRADREKAEAEKASDGVSEAEVVN